MVIMNTMRAATCCVRNGQLTDIQSCLYIQTNTGKQTFSIDTGP